MSPTPIRRGLRRLLDAVHLPISLFLLYYATTALIAGQGPTVLEQAIPTWLTWAWASALILGGTLVVIGVATGRSRAESAGLGFHVFGIGLYIAAYLTTVDRGDVVAVTVLAAVTLLRMRQLRRSRKAHWEATRYLRSWR